MIDKPVRAKRFFTILVASLVIGISSPSFALNVNVNDLTGGAQPTALAAFTQAAGLWKTLLNDPITVNINFNFTPLGPGILGGTNSNTIGADFTNVKSALAGDSTSMDDAVAVANLPTGASMQFRTNDSAGTLILDNNSSNNNNYLDVNIANARALGLFPAADATVDASIKFSTLFSFDFNPADGIGAGKFDFVGISAHEIGHALGFVSGVDIVDITSGAGPFAPIDLNPFRVFSVWDLFRYSKDSLNLGGPGTFDFATDPHTDGLPYFSIDGGTTVLAAFETGQYNGTVRQASHWRDSLGLGIMDPTAGYGELLSISALDIKAFDVMGYNLASVPEPATMLLLGIGLMGIAGIRRKFKT